MIVVPVVIGVLLALSIAACATMPPLDLTPPRKPYDATTRFESKRRS
jgi:hypothetical protein